MGAEVKREDLPIDYEALPPGLTGFYRNIVTYPQIVTDWTDGELLWERDALNSLLVTQPRNANNQVRTDLMEQADKMICEEIGKRWGKA